MMLEAARQIANALVRDAFWFDGRCNWIARTTPAGERRRAVSAPLGPSIYDGLAGVAWFLGDTFALIGEARFKKTSAGAIRQALAAACDLPGSLSGSLYCGALGVAIAALHLSNVLGDDEIRSAAMRLVDTSIGERRSTSEADLLSGRAGAIVALVVLAEILERPGLVDRATSLGTQLIRRAEKTVHGYAWRLPGSKRAALTGWSHGTAGIASALLELFAATGSERFLRAAMKAFDYERSWFEPMQQNWTDLRLVAPNASKRAAKPCSVAWCHGAPGIALSRIRAWEITGDPRFAEEARIALSTTQSAVETALVSSGHNDSLCHGLAGNAAVLHEASIRGPVSANRPTKALIRRAAEASAQHIHLRNTEDVGLFLGPAGAGYLNLRLREPRLASVLLFRASDFRENRSAAESF